MNWTQHVLTVYGLAACSLTGLLIAFASLKREASALRKALDREHEETAAAVTLLRSAFSRLERQQAERERQAGEAVVVAAAAEATSMNLSKRSQALRMYRRGDPIERIASALALPHGEVELLVKVQETTLRATA
jgi:hypothetical protein